MSQFRKTGTYYISKWGGNDANAGTDPLLPRKTINTALTGTVIVGAGHYAESFTVTINLFTDGKVVIDCLNSNVSAGAQLEGVHLKNFNRIGYHTTNQHKLQDCIFENESLVASISTRNTNSTTVYSHRGNVFVSDWAHYSTGSTTIMSANSLFLKRNLASGTAGAYGKGYHRFRNNFVAKTGSIRLHDYALPASFLVTNNCINGIIINAATELEYEIKVLFDGSPRPDANPGIADIITLWPDFYNWGNFAGDPKFIDVISRTVYPDSDLLKRKNEFGYIGNVVPGEYIKFDNPNFTITYQNIDTSNPNILRIADGFTFGKIRMTGKVSDTLISSQQVDIRIPFFFNSDQIGGSATNNNVPDSFNGLKGLDTLGDLPQRLRFEVRTSKLANPLRSNNDDWDNDITGVPGRWYLMEYGQPMLHHVLEGVAYGNADKFAINAPTKVSFNYRSIDMEITLSNTRSQV